MFRLLFGFTLGLAVGIVAGAMLAPTEREAQELAAAGEAGEGGEGAAAAPSSWQLFRLRLAEAAQAGAQAAREMEAEMRARHQELTKRREK
jgi:hypothetical protein